MATGRADAPPRGPLHASGRGPRAHRGGPGGPSRRSPAAALRRSAGPGGLGLLADRGRAGPPRLDGRPVAAGAILALPAIEVPDAPLAFRLWSPGLPLARGRWNVPEPPPEAARAGPDIDLAPLLGWDEAGFRLGHGTGLFDRTLAALAPRPFAIGVGLQGARLSTIHPQPHDVGLDAIVTEAGPQFEERPGPAGAE